MDIESILEMYEDDYNPSSTVPGPRNMNQGGRIPFDNGGDAVRLKALQADYDKFGKKELNKSAKTLGFKDYASMSGQENNNFRRKIKKELTEFGSALPEKESRSRSRVEKRIPKEQGIQIKLLEETNKKKFFDPKKFAKENKISIKQLKDEARKLRNNIYDKRMLVAGKEMRSTLTWIPDDLQAADNALTKMWKSKLIVDDRGKIENLFYDAFKNGSISSKKYLAIRDNLTEYYQLRDAIKAKYPNINLALDHPLSKSSLKNLFNASADQLIRVNPLEFDLNNGFKDSLSQQYEKAMGDSKKGIKPNLDKKKAVEKIARDLKINIGKISDDATNFKYGVKEFQKLNMKDEILKAVQNQADLSDNFKNYVKQNPDLFKTANVNPNTNITKVTQGQVKQVASLLEKLGCGKSAGGRIKYNKGTTCAIKGREVLEKGLKNGFEKGAQGDLARKILGTGKFLKDAVSLRGLFGPAALAFTALAEAGFVGYDMLSSGKSFREAVGDSIFNYALGDKTKIDSDEEFMKRLKNIKVGPQGYQRMGDAEIGKMLNFKANLDDMNRGFDLNRKLQDLEGVQEIRDEEGKVIVKGKAGKILDNQTNQAIGSEFFPDEAFKLDAERDALRADIQDYNRTGTPRRVTDYLLSDKGQEGADASALANLYVEQDQLQDAGIGNIYQSQKGDEKRVQRGKEIGYEIENIINPTEYNKFAKYFMSRPKQEQSMIMGLGYREGGIASLNVNKK